MHTAYAHANYIWYYFAAIGLVSAVALFIYAKLTQRMDGYRGRTDAEVSQKTQILK
jgi:hypothetical protein